MGPQGIPGAKPAQVQIRTHSAQLTRPVRIVLPWATPSQNELQRWHWAKRGRWQKEAAWQVALQMRLCGFFPKEMPDYRVAMEMLRRGPRQLDYGNLVGGAKLLLDVLVKAKLMRDDSPPWLDDVYVQEVGGPASTTVIISRARKVT